MFSPLAALGLLAWTFLTSGVEADQPLVLDIPYRSQLDGSAFAAANCGPTTINMVLEAYGHKIGQPALRKEILSYQPDEDCDDCGVYIQNLAGALSRRGLLVDGLGTGEPETFHRWTIDELRSALRDGHPVVAEVYYRGLPARSNSAYYGDHYIVLTGLLGDRFVFNDPIDAEGPGYSRLISASALDYAMSESDFPYAAFSVAH
jgi:hypothetical protein